MSMTMIRDVLKTTGITATVGIGTNLYLAKIAIRKKNGLHSISSCEKNWTRC